MDWRGRRVTIFGMARSGLALAELLADRGAVVRASDEKPLEELGAAGEVLDLLKVEFVTQGPQALEGCEIAVLSPGVRPDQPLLEQARAAGIEVTGDVEVASQLLRGPVIGVTGSNGKTTTTALIHHLLVECGIAAQMGGNIGTPVASIVEASRPEQWNVLELSSFQTEMLRTMRVHIGLALNVTPDHLDRHGTMERYAEAKRRMFLNQRPGDRAVLNHENEITRGFASGMTGEVYWFDASGRVERGFWMEEGRLVAGGEEWMPASEVRLRGRHNLENVLAAGCAAHLAGADPAALRRAVATFPGVAHRIEFTRSYRGVEYFNDSKATNVDATIKALESFEGGLWVILGGKDKNSDYRPLRALLERRARAVLLIGAAADKIEEQLKGAVRLKRCGELAAALEAARAEARPGDTVLLAPACASFDQFQNYEHRGDVFKQIVTGWAEE
jgi:UDP-N-acetylmuramoylalanine--D-glutamate ligase